jgi:Protein of unknown function, DUF481
LACLLAVISAARADEVVLENGDRITGRITHKGGSILTIDTTYAGTLKINWSSVRQVRTDAPIMLVVTGVSPQQAQLTPVDDGRVDTGAGLLVALRDIVYINPVPEESGIGITYTGHVNLSSAIVTGNSPASRVNVLSEFNARAKDYRYSLLGKLNRATDAGVSVASNWLAGGNYDKFVAEKRFVYLRSSLERDPFKDIERRLTLGAGYGLQLVENDRTNVSLRGGPEAVWVRHVANPTQDYPAVGWGLDAKHKLSGSGIELFHQQDGYWSLGSAHDITIRTRTGLRMPLIKGLNATAQLNSDWEARPAPDRRSTDSSLLFGLDIAW